MSKQTEALKLALEALEEPKEHIAKHRRLEAITAIREALAEQPAQIDPSAGTQVSKVWWNGDKLMAEPIPLEKLYKEPEQPAQQHKLADYEPDGMHHNKPHKCKYPKCPYPCPDLPDCRDAEQQSGIKQVIELYDSPEQPAPPPECKTDAEKTAFAFGWWKALEENRKQPAQQQDMPKIGCVNHDCDKCKSQEPVAWMYPDDYERMITSETFCTVYSVEVGSATRGETTVALYTSPPASKPWVGLTEQERKRAIQFNNAHEALAVVIEAKLREKNT